MKKVIASALFATAMAASTAAGAVTVSTVAGTPIYSGPTPTFNFDGPTPEYDSTIYTSTSPGIREVPLGSTGGFISAGPSPNASPTTLNLTAFGLISSITLLWGSVDEYNTIEFLSDLTGNPGTVIGSFAGSALPTPTTPNGCTNCSTSNVLATFNFAGAEQSLVNYVRFRSTSQAFEVDNVTVNAVPEPAAWGMMLLGFGLVGGALRSRRKSTRVSFA